MHRVAVVLCLLVAACSSAEPAADRSATDLQPRAATAQPDPAPTTSSPDPPLELADERAPAPPGEPIGVTDRVTIVLVDP